MRCRSRGLLWSSEHPPQEPDRGAAELGVFRPAEKHDTWRHELRGIGAHADYPAADPQSEAAQAETSEGDASAGLSAKARGLHTRLHDHAEKAELGAAEEIGRASRREGVCGQAFHASKDS